MTNGMAGQCVTLTLGKGDQVLSKWNAMNIGTTTPTTTARALRTVA